MTHYCQIVLDSVRPVVAKYKSSDSIVHNSIPHGPSASTYRLSIDYHAIVVLRSHGIPRRAQHETSPIELIIDLTHICREAI
jgi:hypothetical protein